MIRGALLHLPGIGPKRCAQLVRLGVNGWHALGATPPEGYSASPTSWQQVHAEVCRCRQALARNEIGYFIDRFSSSDHWRILADYIDDISYFDIETTGLGCDSAITVIACLHRGELHTFVLNENLADFLDLLNEATLLASFNGATFDVPVVERFFHIPALSCPHLDLRWICHHAGLGGGLKHIEWDLGLVRPPDLEGVDGAEAVHLWYRWAGAGDERARARLIRYCSADVLSLRCVAARLLERYGVSCDEATQAVDWSVLQVEPVGSEIRSRRDAPPPGTERPPPPELERMVRHLHRLRERRETS